MFIAVIIPPARKDKAVLGAVAVSFALSYASVHMPVISALSQGNRTILLTVVISAIFAALFPRKTEGPEGGAADAD
jgi:apolipoprotein N-acyltransferase